MATGQMGNAHSTDISNAAVTPYAINKWAEGTRINPSDLGNPDLQPEEVTADGIAVAEPLPTPRVIDANE